MLQLIPALIIILILTPTPIHAEDSPILPSDTSLPFSFVVKNLYASFHSDEIDQLEGGVIEPLRGTLFVATDGTDEMEQNLLHSSIKQGERCAEGILSGVRAKGILYGTIYIVLLLSPSHPSIPLPTFR